MQTTLESRISQQQTYEEKLTRYVSAMRGGSPDRIPIRPFAAEVTARHAGYTCQEVTHDYRKAFDAIIRCCHDYDWDATVPNMVYVWTGFTQAMGLRYYGIPGIDVEADVCFQYREPPEDGAFMRREEYDDLIADPVRFLYETWLPRVSGEVGAGGYRAKLGLVKGSMSMLNYFNAFGPQVERMRTECGTVSAICGMLKAPLDILADKLRGYIGLAFDLKEVPEKVEAACRALMPHLAHVALTSADPTGRIPIPIWMHRGCVPFISRDNFENIYWATLRPIVDALWAQGNQVLFYAEGKWDAHLERFAELPAHSIVYHLDRGNPLKTREVFGNRFCLSGGVDNTLLAFGKPEEVKAKVRWLIETLGAEGGYLVDASAIMQNDATLENLRAMSEAGREYGRFRSPSSPSVAAPLIQRTAGLPAWVTSAQPQPGVCRPFGEAVSTWPDIVGDRGLFEQVWNENEGFANLFIWHVLLSF